MRRLSVRNGNRGFSLAETLIVIAIMGIMVALTAPSMMGLVDGLRLAEAVADVRNAFMETQRQAIRETRPCEVTLGVRDGRVELSGTCLSGGPRQLPERVRIVSNILDSRRITDPTLIASSVLMAPSVSTSSCTSTSNKSGSSSSCNNSSVNNGGNSNSGGTNNTGGANNGGVNNGSSNTGGANTGGANTGGANTGGGNTGGTSNTGGGNTGGANNGTGGSNPSGSTSSGGPLLFATPLAKVKFGIMGTAEFRIANAIGTHTTAGTTVGGGSAVSADPTGKIVFFLEDSPGIDRRCIAISNTLGLTRTGKYTGPMERDGITTDGVCRASESES
jgi:prepilin-type N-terminal cleavage/methylation domain-containing protein